MTPNGPPREGKWGDLIVKVSVTSIFLIAAFFLIGGHRASALAMQIPWGWRFLGMSCLFLGMFAPYAYVMVRGSSPRTAIPVAIVVAVIWTILGLVCSPNY